MEHTVEEHPEKMSNWRWIKLYWLAWWHLSDYAVCTMSKDKGMSDYHDYTDTVSKRPYHFSILTCKRCGKDFII